jgi:type IV pilus assembly protein PilA
MFIKVLESNDFTSVHLMVVMAIIGILAAVALAFYQRHIQKSRLTSKVFPGMHAIQTNLASSYGIQQSFPKGATFTTLLADANTNCFTAALEPYI